MAKIHLIGNAHLDPVWLWRWQEGFSEILATYRSALDRMKEFPNYKFTSACAVYYQWIEKVDKEMFDEIVMRVKEGRWSLAGGWFLQPDCNIPCGESFARHGLISQRYFKEKFDKIAKVGYNVDSFGHNASLPQILKQSKMDAYVFMRPMPEEQGRDETLFLWESADGTQIPTYRIPWFYNYDTTRMEMFDNLKEKAEKENLDMMAFYGVGNHGGGPTIQLLDAIEHLDIPDMVYSTPEAYFAEVKEEKLPVIADELQHHARGCYSACSSIKMGNRKCENNLLEAEKYSVLAEHLVGNKYPKKKYDKAWKNLLFNQFHDVLGGCSVKKAYEDAGYLHGEIMSITEQEINYALQSISHQIDTLQGVQLPSYKMGVPDRWRAWEVDGLGTPIVVFNPHAWPVKGTVEITMPVVKMTDESGNEIPFQVVRGSFCDGLDNKWHTAFHAEVEPMGYRVYRAFVKNAEHGEFASEFKVSEHFLENNRICVEFSAETGDVQKITDKKTGNTILDGFCRAILLDETAADTWAHNKAYLGEEVASFGEPEFQVVEQGPIRAILRVTTRHNESVLRRDYILEPDSDMVRVKVLVDFQEKHRTLKFVFPTAVKETTAKIPYGTITRKNGLGEEPCGSWIATDSFGVANDGKYGYDTLENEVRLTVLRSACYADHFAVRDEFCEYMDMGVHECSYSIFPYTSKVQAEKKAQELNVPMRVITESFHDGPLPLIYSGIQTSSEHTMVTAIKKSEDTEDYILRLCEMDGSDEAVEIKLWGNQLQTKVSHHQIKTLRTDGKELNLIEW